MKTKKRCRSETLALGVRAFGCCLYLCNVDMSVTDAATTMIARFLPIVISIGCHSEANDDNVNPTVRNIGVDVSLMAIMSATR